MSSVSLCSLSEPLMSPSILSSPMWCSELPSDVRFVPSGGSLQEYLLIVDVRSYHQFNSSHIKGATNLCIPTTLLRRVSYPLSAILKDLPTHLKDLLVLKEDDPNINNKTNMNTTILLYDSDSRRGKILVHLCQTVRKFSSVNAKLFVLDGGFQQVPSSNIEYWSLSSLEQMGGPLSSNSQHSSAYTLSPTGSLTLSSAITTPGTAVSLSSLSLPIGKAASTGSTLHPPSSLATLSTSPSSSCSFPLPSVRTTVIPNSYSQPNSSYLTSFTLPSANTPSKQKFLKSLKTNILPKLDMSSIRDNKTVIKSLKVPSSLSADQLPPWLRFVTQRTPEQVLKVLTDKFAKIEKIQQLRLAAAISNSSSNISPPQIDHSACSPLDFCPGCDGITYKLPSGIEDCLKNRYHDVWPFEHSRVKLKSGDNDYFNGNYILDKYIATQNPLVNTYGDFWQLVWENNVCCIISLNGNSKNQGDMFSHRRSSSMGNNLSNSLEYFEDQSLGLFKIQGVFKQTYHAFNLKELELSCVDEDKPPRKVYRLEFEQWPDFGVPTDFKSFIEFIEFKNTLLKDTPVNGESRLLIHCSAGCGRTGVFITLDLLLEKYTNGDRQVVQSEQDQIYRLIQQQRSQRVNMVQNIDQYFVCYELLLYYIKNNGEK